MEPPVHLAFLGDGRNYHIQKWLPAMAEQGIRVTLYTFQPPPDSLPGVAVRPLKPLLGHARWLDFWRPTYALTRRLREDGADVLMASYTTHYGWLGARSDFVPFVVQTWTFDVTVYPFQGWRRWLLRPIVERVLRVADVITTDGPALAETVRTRYPDVAERVVPTTWGIHLADYAPTPGLRAETRAAWSIPPEAPVVVSSRGVSDWYRPEVTLPALRRLLDAHADVHVIVLTLKHEREASVQADLDVLAVHPRAHVFDRFLAKDEMRAVWAASDVLVSVPDRDGISEGVLEGMYAGVIPVVSDIPSNRAILDEARGFFVSERTPDALFATLERVLTDLGVYTERIVEPNRAYVAEHASVEGTARDLADMVRSLAARQLVIDHFYHGL